MLRRQNSILSLLLGVGLVLGFSPSLRAATLSRRARAAIAYRKAQKMRVALESHSPRTLAEYERVLHAFQLVYRTDPGYPETPSSLAAVADVYQEMGRQFASDRYYSKAIEACRFLIDQYPHASLRREALFTIAEIYRVNIENPEEARAAYREYAKKYPHSTKAPEAREKAARLDSLLARRLAPHSPPAQLSRAAPPAKTGSLEEIQSIQHWAGADSTRVVIKLGGPVKFEASHLGKPPRLVFDLSNTRLSPDLAKKVFPVESGFLQRIRVAQFRPRVARVVLDVPQIENYSVFSLPDPFRLVIDIQGKRAALSTKPGAHLAGSPDSSGTRVTASRNAAPGAQKQAARVTPAGASQAAVTQTTKVKTTANQTMAATPVADSSATATAAVAPPAPGVQVSPAELPAPLANASPTLTRALGLKIRRVVIDPGHGGHDTGTVGQGGLEEKTVVLDVARRLKKLVETKMGCQVIMTRSSDTFIPLEERTAIANESGADLFISIHANASRDHSARGIETYYLNFTSDPEALALAARENSSSQESVYQLRSLVKKIALSEKIGESDQFATVVDHELAKHLKLDGDPQPDRGVKKAPFVVLIGANMPSILAEISFLSNRHDEHMLRKASYREKIAKALYDGIERYAESLGTIRVAQQTSTPPASAAQHSRSSF
ncbi:MAG TPA: N-acetylmuramoyl-L-alanine amidase [Terriglobia bacterium]|nr:N-acetylmuramoyl-L-alanine amidase [Terriglobia bacterium]